MEVGIARVGERVGVEVGSRGRRMWMGLTGLNKVQEDFFREVYKAKNRPSRTYNKGQRGQRRANRSYFNSLKAFFGPGLSARVQNHAFWVQNRPHGPWFLSMVSSGLISKGLHRTRRPTRP